MENGRINLEESKTIKMGASSNLNAARLIVLQERKQSIEETLAKRNQELRDLCIKEAELTGIMPTEIPLEPGESPPIFRRRVGTSFQLPQNLINNFNNEDESIASLEINMQIQANMAEAALSLANETNINKTARRRHMTEYQYRKRQYNILEEKLAFLKSHTNMTQQPHVPLQQQKQKKKPRPIDQDDTVSMTVNMQQSEPFQKTVFRHSMRSLQHPYTGENSNDQRHSMIHQKLAYRNSEGSPHADLSTPLFRPEDALSSGIYRLSLNGYKTYMERKESGHIITNPSRIPSHYITSQSNPHLYQQQSGQQQLYPQMTSQTLPHAHTPQRTQQSIHGYVIYPQYSQPCHDYIKYAGSPTNTPRHSVNLGSPGHSSTYSKSSYPAPLYSNRRPYSNVDQQFRTLNPHQIQPHQQYEHDVMTTGLGGYWKRTESGDLVWCSSVSSDSWQRDKRFGSLDRRRNKRIPKRTSPLVDPKSATISGVMLYSDSARPIPPAKAQQLIGRNRQDSRQLVRTQSLGSVGAQTVDSVWPSDDNSSCGSDAHSINEINLASRKHKQKEWFETSLDGPAPSTPTRSHSTIPSTIISISPEEKYIETPQIMSSPQPLHKPPLEIPAESYPNPSPTVPEPNMELFNNNIPKNGTLIQAGHCKPYHEETKPFEMSDFYKYSTKFKKSPVKKPELPKPNPSENSPGLLQTTTHSVQQNLNQSFNDDDTGLMQAGFYQPMSPIKCQPFSPNNNFERSVESIGSPNSINTSLDLSQLAPNVAENFSAEMNAWYQNQEQQIDNNSNTGRQGSGNRSAATLV